MADMHCFSFLSGIEMFLQSQDGIESVDDDQREQMVHVVHDPDTDMTRCREQVEERGYEVDTDD